MNNLNQTQETNEEIVDDIPSMVSFSEDVDSQELPDPIPPGQYIGEIIDATIAKSKQNKLYCRITFSIGADQYPADYLDGSDDGVKLSYFRCPLEDNPGARASLRRFCEAVGHTVKKSFDPTALLGLQARLAVVHDTWQGRKRADIKEISSVE